MEMEYNDNKWRLIRALRICIQDLEELNKLLSEKIEILESERRLKC